jgi:hypothetical protein
MSKFMESIKKVEDTTSGYTQEMSDWSEARTSKHIGFVRGFIDKLPDMIPSEKEDRKRNHDQSKFKSPEYEPYIWINWKYKCLDDGVNFDDYNPPSDLADQMNTATHHHITNNTHHPEYHSPDQTDLLNRDDRDKPPEKMVDATAMPDGDIMEMCCDWAGMSQERGGDPSDWAKKNVNVRWKFDKEQEALIYSTLDAIWETEK